MEDASSNGHERPAYSALPDGHIRLARFHRDPDHDNRLVCSFHEVDLQCSQLQYVAVSYYWGDPTPVARLFTANNQSLPLSKSADNVLQGLISHNLDKYHWIDQVCIDQENVAEKSKQVAMMGNIYSSAYRVIAWLGNAYAWGEHALRFVLRIFMFFAKYRPEGCDFKDLLPQTSVNPDDNGWQCLRKLLHHPWFQRQWIVQEVLMAPIKPEHEQPALFLAYGAAQVSWDVFGWTIAEIASKNLASLLQPEYNISVLSGTPGVYDNRMEIPGLTTALILATLRDTRRKGQVIPMSRALITCEPFRVADPRDKLYSIIGFASSSFLVRPDYLTSVEEIYTELGHQLVVHERNLRSLHSAGIGWNQALAELPSWVPDWTTTHAAISMGNAPGECCSRASLNTAHTLGIDRKRTLRVSGHAVCTIKALFPTPTLGFSRTGPTLASHVDLGTTTKLITTLREFLYEGCIEKDLSGHLIDASIALTLVAHSWNDEAEADIIKSFRCWDELNRGFVNDGGLAQLNNYAMLAEKSSHTVDEVKLRKRGDFLQYARLLGHFTQNRVAFGTSKHWLLGLGPPKAQVGDVVAVLHGAPTPHLLRPSKAMAVPVGTMQTWRLVGDCYVHGIMNGEGMDLAPEQTFTLV